VLSAARHIARIALACGALALAPGAALAATCHHVRPASPGLQHGAVVDGAASDGGWTPWDSRSSAWD
jgi:hypothetical protein